MHMYHICLNIKLYFLGRRLYPSLMCVHKPSPLPYVTVTAVLAVAESFHPFLKCFTFCQLQVQIQKEMGPLVPLTSMGLQITAFTGIITASTKMHFFKVTLYLNLHELQLYERRILEMLKRSGLQKCSVNSKVPFVLFRECDRGECQQRNGMDSGTHFSAPIWGETVMSFALAWRRQTQS